MEENSTPPPQDFTWQVHGRCMPAKTGQTTQPGDYVDGIIGIQEQTSGLGMRPMPRKRPIQASVQTDTAFGVPIDATLALSLIKNALDNSLKFNESFKEFRDKMNAADNDFVNKVLSLTYGITFDKSVILKILSQPNCEALRSYLCAREVDGEQHYSLVMVGVDNNGFDLNYYPTTSGGVEITATSQMNTESMLAEYGYPPGGGTGGGPVVMTTDAKDKYDEHYILLNLADKL